MITLRRHTRLTLAACLFYVLTAFLLLHPILFTTGTHGAGFDYFNYHWNFWWIRHAAHTPGLSIYATDFAMSPFTTNLGYHALTAAWYPVWAVLEPFIGTLAAMNAIIWIAAMLNGSLMFIFLRREGASAAAALIGGLALQAAPNLRYFYYNTHINLMDWFWLPALLLIWSGIVLLIERRRWRLALLAAFGFGAALWGVTLTDLQFPIFSAFLLAPWGMYTLIRARARLAIVVIGAISVITAAALLWFAGPLPHALRFTGTLAPGTVEDRPGIPIPDGFLRMSDAWWEWSQPSIGAWITLVIVIALILALRQRVRDRRWLWFLLMLPPLIFALGPTLHIGETAIPLPFHLLHAQTDGMFRMPWRLAPIAIIAGMTFAALVFSAPLRRLGSARGLLVSAALLLFMVDVRFYQSSPLEVIPPDYDFYHAIAAERGDWLDRQLLVEIPTGAASGEVIFGDPRATQLQWYTLTHHKRLINGFISRAPLEHFYYLDTDDPMLSWLGQRRYLEPDRVTAQLRARIPEWRIGYFILHRDLIGRDRPAVNEIVGFFNQHDDLLCPPFTEGEAVVYRARQHPHGCPTRIPSRDADGAYRIDIGTDADLPHLGWGWHYAESIFDITLRWAGDQPQAHLYADLPPDAYTIEIVAQAYHTDRQLTLLLNGQPIDQSRTVPAGTLTPLTFTLSAEEVRDGRHLDFALAYDGWDTPAALGSGADQRRLAIAVDHVRFIRQDSP